MFQFNFQEFNHLLVFAPPEGRRIFRVPNNPTRFISVSPNGEIFLETDEGGCVPIGEWQARLTLAGQ